MVAEEEGADQGYYDKKVYYYDKSSDYYNKGGGTDNNKNDQPIVFFDTGAGASERFQILTADGSLCVSVGTENPS